MKPSDKNSIDSLFKQGLEDFELEPSNAVWNAIETKLDDAKLIGKKNNYLRMAVAASVLICFFIGFYWVSNGPQKTQLASTETNPLSIEKQTAGSPKPIAKKIIENNSAGMQPIQKDNRLADVVELKSKTNKPIKLIKKGTILIPAKKVKRTENENNAIELLKKMEDDQVENGNKIEEKKLMPQKIILNPSSTIANSKDAKTEINSVIDVLNFVANKVSGNENSKLVAINDKKKADGSGRKAIKIDLGFVKLTRVKNTN